LEGDGLDKETFGGQAKILLDPRHSKRAREACGPGGLK
jgi:hypothetical protein